MVREIFSHLSVRNLGRLVVSCSEMTSGQNPFRGVWRGSGSSGCFGLSRVCGSTCERGNKNEEQKWIGYFPGVFRGRPRGRTVAEISDTDAIWACHSGKPTARKERHALAIVHSLTTNPYCS